MTERNSAMSKRISSRGQAARARSEARLRLAIRCRDESHARADTARAWEALGAPGVAIEKWIEAIDLINEAHRHLTMREQRR
jgi:hypothetical protein